MDGSTRIALEDALRGLDDRFAIFAEPPGVRDLGCPVLWDRSLERSRRRRQAAAQRGVTLPRTASARISATLVAASLVGTAAPTASAVAAIQSSTVTGELRHGARGERVAALQRALGIPADGVFGPDTRRAVRAFQRSKGLQVDGRVGPQTTAALGMASAARTVAAVRSTGAPVASGVTRAVQQALGVAVDGVFGPQTRGALIAYQRAHGLIVDGIVGPQVMSALGISGQAPTIGTSTTGSTVPVSQTTPVASDGAGPSTTAASAGVMAAVAAAQSKIGAPYVSAGSGPNGFDCSGLTSWAMRQAGISIPRTSFAQFGTGSPVSQDAIQAGDLVFFNTAGPGASDVGIATGPNTVISATTHGVMSHTISDGYWGAHYVGARRVA